MKRIVRLLAAGAMCLAIGNTANAIELGDPAPPLQIAKWIKGKQVELAACKTTSVVVVDLWATWCPFCIESIPHLTELQKKYGPKCVQVVGISAEEETVVEDFVNKMGDKMHYSVALDKDQTTSIAYLNASKQEGIPQTFIVDKEGCIVWHGPPMQIDKPLEQVVAGTYDISSAKKRAGALEKLEELWRLLSKEADEAQIKPLVDELTALDKECGGIMPDGKSFDLAKLKNMAEFNRLGVQYQKAILNDESDARIDEIAAKMKTCAPDEFDAGMLRDVRVQILAKLYIQEASSPAVNETNLVKRAEKMVSVTTTNANLLNEIAWTILTGESIHKRDWALALKVAKSAMDACGGNSAEIVDTYARALFDNKQVKEAVDVQKKAIELTEEESLKQEMTITLKKYEASLTPSDKPPVPAEGDSKQPVTPKTP